MMLLKQKKLEKEAYLWEKTEHIYGQNELLHSRLIWYLYTPPLQIKNKEQNETILTMSLQIFSLKNDISLVWICVLL